MKVTPTTWVSMYKTASWIPFHTVREDVNAQDPSGRMSPRIRKAPLPKPYRMLTTKILICYGVSVGRGTLTLDEHTPLWIDSELPTHERESRGNKMECVCVTKLHWYQSCPNAVCRSHFDYHEIRQYQSCPCVGIRMLLQIRSLLPASNICLMDTSVGE